MDEELIVRTKKLVDGKNPEPLFDREMVIQGDHIVGIRPSGRSSVRKTAQIFDCEDGTVVPGMINAHVHLFREPSRTAAEQVREEDRRITLLRMARSVKVALLSGLTTIRDCGGLDYLDVSVKRAIDSKIIDGPRLLIAGKAITTTGGHFHFASFEADGIDELIKAIRMQIREGADFIKIMNDGSSATSKYARRTSQYKEEELQAAVDEAHKLGKKVALHAHSTAAIRTAVSAGVDTIEHCYWLGEEEGFNYDEKIVQEISRKGIFVIPTLPVGYPRSKKERIDPGLRPLKERLEELMNMYKKGIQFVAGGDEGGKNTLITENVYTLELFVQAGLSPFQALQSSTKVAAECLGIDHLVGTLEEGKKADLLVVQGDPLENISHLWNVKKVMKDGRFMT